jgi:hypothetical protein
MPFPGSTVDGMLLNPGVKRTSAPNGPFSRACLASGSHRTDGRAADPQVSALDEGGKYFFHR